MVAKAKSAKMIYGHNPTTAFKSQDPCGWGYTECRHHWAQVREYSLGKRVAIGSADKAHAYFTLHELRRYIKWLGKVEERYAKIDATGNDFGVDDPELAELLRLADAAAKKHGIPLE